MTNRRASTDRDRRKSPLARAAQVAAVAVVGLFFAWTGASAATLLKSMFAEPVRPRSANAAGPTFTAASPVGDFGPGVWTVAGMPWSLEIVRISPSDLVRRMERVPGDLPDTIMPSRESEPLLTLCRSCCPAGRTAEDHTVYAMDQQSVRVRIFARIVAGTERLVAGCFAYPCEDGNWNLIVARPLNASQSPTEDLCELLPLPETAHRICSRRDAAGRLQCQLVSCADTPDTLAARWRAEGWTIDRQVFEGGTVMFCCLRRGVAISVYVRHDPAQDRSMLLLVNAAVTGSEVH